LLVVFVACTIMNAFVGDDFWNGKLILN
jgi:hypothetical protein